MQNLIDRLNPKRLFKARIPDLNQFIGKEIKIPGVDEVVKIEKITGNRFKQTFFEINGEHLIGMLRFFALMYGDDSITEQQFRDFEEMELEAEAPPEKKSVLEMPVNPFKIEKQEVSYGKESESEEI